MKTLERLFAEKLLKIKAIITGGLVYQRQHHFKRKPVFLQQPGCKGIHMIWKKTIKYGGIALLILIATIMIGMSYLYTIALLNDSTKKYFYNPEVGESRQLLLADGTPVIDDTGNQWKYIYHTDRAMMECCLRIESLTE